MFCLMFQDLRLKYRDLRVKSQELDLKSQDIETLKQNTKTGEASIETCLFKSRDLVLQLDTSNSNPDSVFDPVQPWVTINGHV